LSSSSIFLQGREQVLPRFWPVFSNFYNESRQISSKRSTRNKHRPGTSGLDDFYLNSGKAFLRFLRKRVPALLAIVASNLGALVGCLCKGPLILLEFWCGTFFTYPQHPEAP
jgi:hypothetical protein